MYEDPPRYLGDFYGSRRFPPKATASQPGSEDKIQIMRDRLESGFHLHHPLDNRGDDV